MPVELTEQAAELTGQISIDDAELLYQWLLEHPSAQVTLRQPGHLHTAIWQLLLMFRPKLQIDGVADDVVQHWLVPELLFKE